MNSPAFTCSILGRAVRIFSRMDGTHWAGAFAHYAFFALFPLIILLVTLAAIFVERNQAGTQIIALIETYLPIGAEEQSYIFDTLAGVINARRPVSLFAFAMLGWASLRLFVTLVRAINRAWGTEARDWWRLPLKSLVFLGILATGVPLGLAVPVLARIVKQWLSPTHDFSSWVYSVGGFLVPLFLVFLCLSLIYRVAPRRRTRFAEIWFGALWATLFLKAFASLFGLYLREFASLNAVYGAFGGIMGLLLWIYLSGGIVIFGACLCAAQSEGRARQTDEVSTLAPGGVAS
jgi:YihY family inner membrane protein